MNFFRGVLCILIVGVLFSCDAPRINPLDPENPDYNLSTIEGKVYTEKLPRQPIPNVKVFWKNHNILVETNTNGNFIIEELPRTSGWLIVEKNGFSKDSTWINLALDKKTAKEFYLNSIPNLESYNITSEVKSTYTSKNYSLFFSSRVTDLENDIDSIVVQSSSQSFSYRKKLIYNITSKNFEYKHSDLTSVFIDEAIGKNFEIIVFDKSSKVFSIGSASIKRIITKEVEFKAPANGVIVERRPTLSWVRYDVGFYFKYKVQIFTKNNDTNSYWERLNISKEDIELTMPTDLPPGDYYWVIWCIDDFQNSFISKPASFSVR